MSFISGVEDPCISAWSPKSVLPNYLLTGSYEGVYSTGHERNVFDLYSLLIVIPSHNKSLLYTLSLLSSSLLSTKLSLLSLSSLSSSSLSKNLFLSPMADGPVKYVTNLDNNLNVINISKYGRDFSIVKVPYAFKLLMQELMSIKIVPKFILDE